MSETVQTVVEGNSCKIKVDIERTIGDINPNIYSGFVEHMGRCVYGGLVDYDSKEAPIDDHGHRTDVMEALKELNMPVVRYPGGNFCAQYHWLDGVGPKSERPRRVELAWLNEESNEFGTDEFMLWCKEMKCEPYICFNMGTGTLDEALGWLEYCNGTGNTHYANLRRKNGHSEPYNVKYWGLGNEIWGPWQVEQDTAEHYAKKAFQWAKALKLLDSSIILVACGCDGLNEWDIEITQKLISKIDLYSIHLYTSDGDYYKNVTGPAAAERGIQIVSRLLDLARITGKAEKSNVKICFDEWNVWDPVRANGEFGAEEKYTLADALAVASWLNVFVRQARQVAMANIAQIVNVISPLLTSKTGLLKQTTFFPFKLFSQHMRGKSLNLHVQTPLYKGETDGFGGNLKWIQHIDPAVPMLDVSASVNEKYLTIVIVNRHETDDLTTVINLDGSFEEKVHTWTLYHENANATNTFENPNNVMPVESETSVDVITRKGYEFQKHSFTMLQLTIKKC